MQRTISSARPTRLQPEPAHHSTALRRAWPIARGILLFVAFLLAFFAALEAVSLAFAALAPAMALTPAGLRLLNEAMPLALVLLISAVFGRLLRRHAEMPRLVDRHHVGRDTALGIGLGAGLTGLVVGGLLACGALDVEGARWDASLPLWVLALTLNAAFQEYLVRGWGFDVLVRSAGPVAATLVTTVAFTLLHPGAFEVGPVAVACIAAFSVALSLLRLVTGGLLAPILVHAIWNNLGGIGLGLVALADDYPHVLDATLSGSPLISGGAAGMEGSVITLALLLVLCVVLGVILCRIHPTE